jgi:hypothetical protein
MQYVGDYCVAYSNDGGNNNGGGGTTPPPVYVDGFFPDGKYKTEKQPNYNDCGTWAAAREISSLAKDLESKSMDYLASQSQKDGKIYRYDYDYEGFNPFESGTGGIQPMVLFNAAGRQYGSENVSSYTNYSLGNIYEQVKAGNTVVVDMAINHKEGQNPTIATEGGEYAHFARVLGVDLRRGLIYLSNSIKSDGLYPNNHVNFILTENEYYEASRFPETRTAGDNVKGKNDEWKVDNYDRWALIIKNGQ